MPVIVENVSPFFLFAADGGALGAQAGQGLYHDGRSEPSLQLPAAGQDGLGILFGGLPVIIVLSTFSRM